MIYTLYAPENKHDDWLFSTTAPSGVLQLKNSVALMSCSKCGKFIEEEVIKTVGPGLKFTSLNKAPAFSSLDDWIIVNELLSRQLAEHGTPSFAVNNEKTLYALTPPQMDIEIDKAGFEYNAQHCEKCGRPREATVGPLVESHILPSIKPFLWTTKIHNESIKGARPGVWFEKINLKFVKALFGNKFEYMPAL